MVVVCFLLFLSVITFSLYLFKIYPQEEIKIYYLPSLEYLKLASGSFTPLISHILFIKGILELSEEVPNRTNYFLKLFEISINLDPKLVSAYFFGGVIVPTEKEEIPLGIKFLKEGIRLNPSEWRIPFWIGFNYLQLGAYSKVIEYYKIASHLPNSPSYLRTNLAFYYYKADRPKEGILYLESLLGSLKDERLLKMIEKKIEWLKGLVFLETKVEEYKSRYGVWPSDLKDLIEKGLIDKIPQDPFGKGYYLDEQWYKYPGRIRSRF